MQTYYFDIKGGVTTLGTEMAYIFPPLRLRLSIASSWRGGFAMTLGSRIPTSLSA